MKCIDFCVVVSPTWLDPYFNAIIVRFAVSEREYFQKLDAEAKALADTSRTLRQFARDRLPLGGLDTMPILQNILDAMNLRGSLARLQGREVELHIHGTPGRHIQSKVMMALRPNIAVTDIANFIVAKFKVTLSFELFESISDTFIDNQWFTNLSNVLQEVKIHCRMCWWKTVCGAWTTSHRMHEDNRLPCMFGCCDSDDTICHYLICPALWQLAREACSGEESSNIAYRLCLVSPSANSLRRLAIVFGIYHACKNDSLAPSTPALVQSRAVGFAKSVASVLT
jgi:hypothetical protein